MPMPARLLLALVLAAGAGSTAQAQRAGDIAFGRTLANENCSRCHAVGTTGRSAQKGAPPFRLLYKRYDVDALQEAFVEGIAVGHRGVDMPEFQFTPERTDALITYIKSLRPKRK